jgi:hypothetical protein
VIFFLHTDINTLHKLISAGTCHESIVCIVDWLSYQSTGEDEPVETRSCLVLAVTKVKFGLNMNFVTSRNEFWVVCTGSRDLASVFPALRISLAYNTSSGRGYICSSVCLVSKTSCSISMKLFIMVWHRGCRGPWIAYWVWWLGYGLWDGDNAFRFPAGTKHFSPLQSCHTGCGAHAAFF